MNDTFRQELKRHRLKATSARMRVFEVLRDRGPLGMNELIARIDSSDRASVYRAVTLFERLDILHHLIVGGRKVLELTERFTGHHHHLTCTVCGRLQDIDDRQLEAALRQVARAYGFTPRQHVIEVSGICAACATDNR